jgi:hypothetical protein
VELLDCQVGVLANEQRSGALPVAQVSEARTSRSSERVPAGTPNGDVGARGGWLPSLTLGFNRPEAGIQNRNSTTQIREDNRMTTDHDDAQKHPCYPAFAFKDNATCVSA